MASKRSAKTKQSGKRDTLQREILGLLLVALGGVCLLSLLAATRGVLSQFAATLLRQAFGWGAFFIAGMLLAGGIVLLWRNLNAELELPWQKIMGFEALFVIALSLTHLLSASAEQGFALAQSGHGGGYVGWSISFFLTSALGRLPAYAVLTLLGLSSLVMIMRPPLSIFEQWFSETIETLRHLEFTLPRRESAEAMLSEQEAEPEPTLRQSAFKPQQPRPVTDRGIAIVSEREKPRKVRRSKNLPPIDLLEADSEQPIDEKTLSRQAQIIEETLESFGVPASVVEVQPGPTVTQFGVEPGYMEKRGQDGETQQAKVRVNKITALSNDLALALAAAPIRIQAPVPGRAIVGIEVPNPTPAFVSLRGVMESKEYGRLRAPLKIALGRNVAGKPIVADLSKMPHLLIAGATGSGKSACINALLTCLLMNNSPDNLRLILVDPKRVELIQFGGIPHLLGSVMFDVDKVLASIKWLTREMERRYRLFSEAGARNLGSYNRKAPSLDQEPLPHIVVFVDELAELMMVSPDEVERYICRLAQLARATGIHLVIATQRPSVDVVTGLIKANFPARICFATTSQIDSRVVLDTPGAEKLLGRGDLLFMPPDSSKLIRAQGCFLSDGEINRITQYWREKVTVYLDLVEEETPWKLDASAQGSEEDDLLDSAVDLIQEHQQASASFLQRKLRIGYPRAARLIDELEENGYIGPAVSGGRSRDVLIDDEDQAEAMVD